MDKETNKKQFNEWISVIIDVRPSMSEACRAKCFECTVDFADGHVDCHHYSCPMYQRMPYRRNQPDYSWLFGTWSKRYRIEATRMGLLDNPLEYARRKFSKTGLVKDIRVPMSSMIRAKCFRCCGDYDQARGEKGRIVCGAGPIKSCPIHYWTPYRNQVADLAWMFELEHTSKHRRAIAALGIDHKTYIQQLLIERSL